MSSTISAALLGLTCATACAAAADACAQDQQAAPLTREAAIRLALGDDPRLSAAEAARDAAAAGVRQAGRAPNPSLDVRAENVEGSGPYQSWERAETTYALTQRLELGGDRGARRRLAERDLDAARLGGDIGRLDVIEEVEFAFIDAQAAEAARAIAQERLAVAQDLAAAVRRRVAAARDPLMAGARAEARLAEAQVEADGAQRAAIAARARLASYWGGAGDFAIEVVSFERLSATPPSADGGGLRGRLDDSAIAGAPDLALAQVNQERAEARVDLERARVIPDPDLQVGWRTFGETDETALVFGFSMPLQIWDRNADAVARARAESARAGYDTAARERALARERAMLAAQLQSARLEVEALDASVLPHGQEALDRAREGYAMGGFSYLDVLEAQRALSDARLRRIGALRSYHRTEAALARLAGAHLSSVSDQGVSR